MTHKKRSLTQRVVVTLILAITATMSLAGATLYGVFRDQYAKELLSHAEITTTQLSLSLAPSLWNLDYNSASQIAGSILLDKSVSCIMVSSSPDTGDYSGERERSNNGNIVQGPGCSDCGTENMLVRDVVYKGRVIGQVRLCISYGVLKDKLHTLGVIILAAILSTDVMLILLLYYKLNTDVLKPLKMLEDYALLVSTDTDTWQRTPGALHVREFENLRTTIETMVEKLSTRYQQLLESKNDLTEAEKRHRSTIENALVGIFQTTIDGHFLAANSAGAHILGYDSPEQLVQTVPNVEQFYVDVADRNKMLSILFQDKVATQYMFRFKRADGAERWALVNARLIDDYDDQRTIESMLEDITEKKKNEEELNTYKVQLENLVRERTAQLEESERYLASLLGSLPGVAYRCIGGKAMNMEFVSQGVTELTGYAPSELINSTDKCFSDLIVAHFAEYVTSKIAAALDKRAPFDLVYKIVTRTGDEKWVSDKGRGVYSERNELLAVEGFISDITDRTLAEDKLRESEETFRNILHGIKAGFLAIDAQTVTVIGINSIAEGILDVSKDEIIGKSCNDIIWTHVKSSKPVNICPIGQGEAVYDEFRVTRRDGDIVPISMTLLPAMRSNQPIYYEVIFDITEQKALERQLVQAQRLESIGSLAAGIAHEINTPIQYIGDNLTFLEGAFANLTATLRRCWEQSGLKDGKNSELEYLMSESPKAVSDSMEGVTRVATIVSAMKRFAHPGSAERVPLDVNKAIETTVEVARNEWKYHAEVKLDLDPHLEFFPCFAADFNQVILNMLVNAAHAVNDKYQDRSDKGLITIRTQKAQGHMTVSISDTGCGIPPENLHRIYDPFFTTKEVGKGTGQGLAITHDIVVNKHGGSIDVESEPGIGTTFTLRFPLSQGARPSL
jgi:PAS domain S-box-containing protein